jgi:hypothetical protein
MRDFLENRPVVATSAQAPMIKPVDSPLLHPSLRIDSPQSQEFPKLELKKDAEGKIKEIVVHCHCGERVVLQCTY